MNSPLRCQLEPGKKRKNRKEVLYYGSIMKKQLVPASIHGIALDKESQLPIVLLETAEPRGILAVPVGPSEASAIIVEVEGVHPPRPLTHDLIAELFSRHQFSLVRSEIREHLEELYTSRICYRRGLRQYTMEVRPSDAIALSLRMRAPIMVNPELLTRGESSLEVFRHLHGDDILLLEPHDCRGHAV
jgi:bifunctional DNase/RNase